MLVLLKHDVQNVQISFLYVSFIKCKVMSLFLMLL
jgi:hypothetical protein